MIVSRMPDGKWVEGVATGSVWSCESPSIGAARMRYFRSGGVSAIEPRPEIETGYYVIPREFTPVGRLVAKAFGTRYYVGQSCGRHPLNHVRSTTNKTCVVCEILKDYL